MAKNHILVTVYKLNSTDIVVDSFVEAVSQFGIAFSDGIYAAYIVASSDILDVAKLNNMAIRFFGENGYNISTIDSIGPFKSI